MCGIERVGEERVEGQPDPLFLILFCSKRASEKTNFWDPKTKPRRGKWKPGKRYISTCIFKDFWRELIEEKLYCEHRTSEMKQKNKINGK